MEGEIKAGVGGQGYMLQAGSSHSNLQNIQQHFPGTVP